MAVQPNLLDNVLALPIIRITLTGELWEPTSETDAKFKRLTVERELRADLVQLLGGVKNLLHSYRENGLNDANIGALVLMFRGFDSLLEGVGRLEPSNEPY